MFTKSRILVLILFLIHNFYGSKCFSQTVPQGITYQGLARNAAGNVLSNQAISVKFGIYSPTPNGVLNWEETNSVVTNNFGLFYVVIGQGVSTGNGSSSTFSSIDWSAGNHFLRIAMDATGGTAYLPMDTIQFWAVPYAFNAGKSDGLTNPLRLNDLIDVDTIGAAIGNVLKWNGSLWLPAIDNNSDTAMFAYNSNHSNSSDTALYAFNIIGMDSVLYAQNAGSSASSDSASFASNSAHSINSDTSLYALNTLNSWNLNGNGGTNATTNFIGTTDNTDLVIKTANTERMRITSAGRVGIGISNPTSSLQVVGNDGFTATGTFGSGATAPSGAGTRMFWYPRKGAFRVGGATTNWNDANIGNYSFASGYDTRASGIYSTSFGYLSVSSGAYSSAGGDRSTASGFSSVAMGSVCTASGVYSVAFVRSSLASDSAAVAIGYHNIASGKYSLSFGSYTVSSGMYSTTMGYKANTNGKKGSFVYADYANLTDTTFSTADNQFMVRASGGVIFYSNAALTSGVSLAAGGGSWSSVSDRNKKENIKKIDGKLILEKLSEFDVYSWNYKSQDPSIRHIGPMAQDFYKAFKYGESDTTITTVDIDGVNLIAIQALAKKTEELKLKALDVEKLKSKIDALEAEKRKLEARILDIENKLSIGSTAIK